jgi:hypothetical protein
MIKNYIKSNISIKPSINFGIFGFLFITAIFTRSFIGISIFGFRLGELLIGFSLFLSMYFLIYPKPDLFFSIGNTKFKRAHQIIIFFLLSRLIFNYDKISLYQFKSSSTVWTIAFIYLGVFTSLIYKRSKFIVYCFSFLPIILYFFQSGNYPNYFISLFQKYSDKFQYMKAADMVLVVIICSIFIKQSQKNSNLSLLYLNFTCFLFLPLIAINSRGALLGLILFCVIENINYINYLKDKKSLIPVVIMGSFIIFSLSSIRISNIGVDLINVEEVNSISNLPKVVNEIAEKKNTQDIFFSLYFSDGRIYSKDPTANWRLDIWQDVFEDLNNKNLLLYGYGYDEIIPVMTDPSAPGRLGRDGLNENVHNYFVTVFARGGIINLILFLILHYQIVKTLMNSRLGRTTFSFVIPSLLISSLDITMDGVQFPFLYYFFIGFFSFQKV